MHYHVEKREEGEEECCRRVRRKLWKRKKKKYERTKRISRRSNQEQKVTRKEGRGGREEAKSRRIRRRRRGRSQNETVTAADTHGVFKTFASPSSEGKLSPNTIILQLIPQENIHAHNYPAINTPGTEESYPGKGGGRNSREKVPQE